MNDRKRSASEALSSVHSAKRSRTALVAANGEKQSPGSATALASRWKHLIHEITGLAKDTFLVTIRGRDVSSDSRSISSEERPSESPSPSPQLLSQTATAEPTQIESLPTTPGAVNSFPTNLAATSSYSSIPSTSHFSFTPRTKPWITSSQSSEISFPTFSSSVTPLNNPYSSRRKRTKTIMGPPPDPPFSVAFSQSFSALDKNLQSLKTAERLRNYANRPHILHNKHKQEVRKAQEATRQALFKLKQKRGFKSSRKDFDSYIDYFYELQKFGGAKPRISPSMIDLRSEYKSNEEKSRSRRHSDSITESQWLERQLEMAQKMLNEPRPPAWSPSLDDLRLRHRNKDDRIEQRLRPKRAPLPSSLPPEAEARVQALLKQPGVISKYAREQVSNGDLVRLKPGCWLNDEIINFYGAMILGRSEDSKENKENSMINGVISEKKNKALNVHYFSTFFWQKLERDGYEKGRLAKWTKKIDLFSKDIVLIPVNHDNMHWTAAAINFRRKRIESYDSMMLDRSTVFKRLREYLDAEHRNKKKTPFDFTDWENHVLEDTPLQENGFDCGVFTCQFLETLSRGEETFNFNQSDIPYLRRRMIWEIGSAKLRSDA